MNLFSIDSPVMQWFVFGFSGLACLNSFLLRRAFRKFK